MRARGKRSHRADRAHGAARLSDRNRQSHATSPAPGAKPPTRYGPANGARIAGHRPVQAPSQLPDKLRCRGHSSPHKQSYRRKESASRAARHTFSFWPKPATPEQFRSRCSDRLAISRSDAGTTHSWRVASLFPTPYVDKTVYVGWNGLCISAYLEAAKVLGLDDARRFALRSLDRTLSEAWRPEQGLLHVIAYSDPKAGRRHVRGLLDDYAFLALAYLDAYEASADLSYFDFSRRITGAMGDNVTSTIRSREASSIPRRVKTEKSNWESCNGRKPFQDSPTPAGNSMAAIALLACMDTPANRAISTRLKTHWKCLRGWRKNSVSSVRPTPQPVSTS